MIIVKFNKDINYGRYSFSRYRYASTVRLVDFRGHRIAFRLTFSSEDVILALLMIGADALILVGR